MIAPLTASAAAQAAPAPVVAVAGDVACAPGEPATRTTCRQQQVADAIERSRPDSVWLLGDNQYPSGDLADFQGSFDKSYGIFRKIWRPVVGNHEYVTPGAAGYFDYFGRAAGPRAKGYYSFNLGRWHVVSLNSNCSIIACDSASAQYAWLKADLAKHRRTCVAAMWHHPRFSSGAAHGSDPATTDLWRLLQARRAELVLSGHEHDFEVFRRQTAAGTASSRGMTQFVVGTGGKSAYRFGKPLPNSLVRESGIHGFLKLRLLPRSYSWRFVGEDGAVLKRGAARCRA